MDNARSPEHLSISMMLKATPSEEDGERFIYFEASNESLDLQHEKVLAKALEESAEHYLKFGNVDLDHYTILGPRMGIAQPLAYEVGRPVSARIDGKRTFVKAQLYRGETPLAANANMVWDSMTQLSPPARWYPSVGGSVLAKSIEIDPDTKNKVTVVKKVRWTNVALSRTPVNDNLPEAGTMPMAVFAKSLGGLVLKSGLTAGYGTDMATLTGGDAVRRQSLDGVPQSYFDFRDKLASAIKSKKVEQVSRDGLTVFCASHFKLSPDEATAWVDRFLTDLKARLTKRRKS